MRAARCGAGECKARSKTFRHVAQEEPIGDGLGGELGLGDDLGLGTEGLEG